MKLLNVVKMIIGLGAVPSQSAGGDDAAGPTDGKGVRNDKRAVRLGPRLLLSAAALTAGGGLFISQAAGTVTVGFDLEKGFVFEITKLERDIVKELEEMGYTHSKAGQVRQVRSNGKGPWAYPKLELIARVDRRVQRREAAVCPNSELLGERIVLSNKADDPTAFGSAVKVSASWFEMSCSVADPGDQIVLVNPVDMKEMAGHEVGRQIKVYGSVLPKDLTSQLPSVTTEMAGSANSSTRS